MAEPEQGQPQESTRYRGPTSRVDDVGQSGVYPASGPMPSGPAELRGQSEFMHPEERRNRLLMAPRPSEANTTLNLIGRAVFGGYFIYNGINHFLNREQLVGYARHKGVPMADLAVPLTGAMLIAGGTSVLLGKHPRLGTGLIMGFLATVSPTIHAFWADKDEQERMADAVNFAKNIGLIGAALLAASQAQPWPKSIDRALQSWQTD
jgi:putative oxidoreductase